jgi:transcriptional regulator with XRE-family HTH domain/molybdate-binding protein
MRERLRDCRRAAGWTQSELAEVAGVSRSLVAAVEAGRNQPSVDAALAMARALGRDVESLFGAGDPRPAPRAEPVGRAAAPGSPVRLSRVRERLVYAPLPGAEGLGEAADAVLLGPGRVEMLPGGEQVGVVVAGCEPSLGLLARLLPGRGAQRLIPVHATSTSAAQALHAGRCHVAVVHGRASDLKRGGASLGRLEIGRWRVGLACVRGTDRSLERLLRGAIVQRGRGAAAQRALVRALREAGLQTARGPQAEGHLDAIRRLEAGAAPVALTTEPLARAAGLDFVALEEHRVELRFDAADPQLHALLEIVESGAYRTRLRVQGYELGRSAGVSPA